MSFTSLPPWLLLMALGTVLPAAAQTAPAPTSTQAPPVLLGPASFHSVLEGYQGFRDEKIIPWREANDNVGRIGGWRAYAKEAQQPATPTDTAPLAPSQHEHHQH